MSDRTDTDLPVPLWPLYRLTADDNGKVSIAGPAAPQSPYSTRNEAVEAVAALAGLLSPARPVRAEAVDPDGTTYPLLVAPDHTVTEDGPPRPARGRRRPNKRTRPAPVENEAVEESGLDELLTAPSEPERVKESAVTPAPRQTGATSTAPIPSILRIRGLAEAGRTPEALAMAAALDDATARTHGPSDPTALEARAVHAHLRAESGDLTTAVSLYRDIAERWAMQGEMEHAESAADRAHALWLRISDPHAAIAAGETVVRMRSQIPGQDGRPYRQAVARLARARGQ